MRKGMPSPRSVLKVLCLLTLVILLSVEVKRLCIDPDPEFSTATGGRGCQDPQCKTNELVSSSTKHGHGPVLRALKPHLAPHLLPSRDLSAQTSQDSTPVPPLALSSSSLTFHNLSAEEMAGVEKFLFFVGYGRSGHSIVASILDAHPNIIIAHEYYLFDRLAHPAQAWHIRTKRKLFNQLYWSSYQSVVNGWRANVNTSKGYNLNLKGAWQGQFDKLRIIGDKTAGSTAMIYYHAPLIFKRALARLDKITGIPHLALHVVRNPYDMIATVALYQASEDPENTKVNASVQHKFHDFTYINMATDIVLTKALAVSQMVVDCNLHLLEVHLEDLISDPDTVIRRLCHFLGVDCDSAFLDMCRGKLFRSPSRSRDVVVWPRLVRERIQEAIEDFSFFKRYSFES